MHRKSHAISSHSSWLPPGLKDVWKHQLGNHGERCVGNAAPQGTLGESDQNVRNWGDYEDAPNFRARLDNPLPGAKFNPMAEMSQDAIQLDKMGRRVISLLPLRGRNTRKAKNQRRRRFGCLGIKWKLPTYKIVRKTHYFDIMM